jgi:predicted transglutaminase-like cysteine proteinase
MLVFGPPAMIRSPFAGGEPMKYPSFLATAVLLLTGCMSTSPTNVGSPHSAHATGKPPLGFAIMCLKTPRECEGGGEASVSATPQLLAMLIAINEDVNRSIKPHPDGRRDVWSAGATYGDCEEYVLAKRRALMRARVDASSLRIAFVKTTTGRDHAVLIVRTTNGGDLVLDNLTNTVMPIARTGYRLVAMSGTNPTHWSM